MSDLSASLSRLSIALYQLPAASLFFVKENPKTLAPSRIDNSRLLERARRGFANASKKVRLGRRAASMQVKVPLSYFVTRSCASLQSVRPYLSRSLATSHRTFRTGACFSPADKDDVSTFRPMARYDGFWHAFVTTMDFAWSEASRYLLFWVALKETLLYQWRDPIVMSVQLSLSKQSSAVSIASCRG